MTANRIDNQNPSRSTSGAKPDDTLKKAADLAKQGHVTPVAADETARNQLVGQLLNRATGALTSSSGTASTTSTNGAVAATVVRAELANSVASKNATQANLGPVTAPRVIVDNTNAQGAKNFAANVDKVISNHLNAMSDQVTNLFAANPNIRFVNATPAADQIAIKNPTLSTSGAIFMHGTSTGLARTLTSSRVDSTGILSDNGSGALANASELQKRIKIIDMTTLSADQLLAEFLKLNINDPNANVETQDKLYQVASQMRQLELDNAKKKIENAEELIIRRRSTLTKCSSTRAS